MTNINISIDDSLKMQAETICDELGITLSSAANIFFRQLVRAGGIPFEMRDPFYSSQNQEYLQASIDEYEANKETGIVKTLDELLQMEK